MPRNNKYIYYEKDAHRHILSADYMRDKYSITLDSVLDTTGDIAPETAPQRFLNQVSLTIHGYIYRHSKNMKVTEYLLANNDDYIDCLQEAMGQLAYSMLLQNTNISILTGVNLESGKEVDRAVIREETVPVNVEDILRRGGLLYRGVYPAFDYKVLTKRGKEY